MCVLVFVCLCVRACVVYVNCIVYGEWDFTSQIISSTTRSNITFWQRFRIIPVYGTVHGTHKYILHRKALLTMCVIIQRMFHLIFQYII